MLPAFPWPSRFGWSNPIKPDRPTPPPTAVPNDIVPVCFSTTVKMMSTSPLTGSWRISGDGIGVSKKPSDWMFWYDWMMRAWL